MPLDPASLPPAALAFLTERHLATLSTVRPDGSPHVAAVGFTWEPSTGLARVITDGGSRKAANVRAGSRAVVAQVDGPRWAALEGPAVVSDDPERVPGRSSCTPAATGCPARTRPGSSSRSRSTGCWARPWCGSSQSPPTWARPSQGVLSTTVVRVETCAAARISWSSDSSSPGPGTRTLRM